MSTKPLIFNIKVKQAFWMVFNPKRRAPKVKHLTLASAKAEVARLKALQPKDVFYILRSVALM